MDVATAFLGHVMLHDQPSVALVTNCHVLGSEEITAKSLIEFDGVDAP